MKKLAPTLVLLLALAPLAGCDGDDPTAPAGSSGPSLFLMGELQVRDGVLEGFLEFWDVTSSGARIDSVRIGDALVVSDFESEYYSADDAYWGTGLRDHGVEDFAVGDTVEVRVFVDGEVATVDLVLLDPTEPLQMTVMPADPLPRDATVTYGWTEVEGADFYSVGVQFVPAAADASVRNAWRDFVVTEPGLSLPPEFTAQDGQLNVRITALHGPVPTAEGVVPANVETASLRGQLWSQGASASSRVTVGTGGSSWLASPPSSGSRTGQESSVMSRIARRSWR